MAPVVASAEIEAALACGDLSQIAAQLSSMLGQRQLDIQSSVFALSKLDDIFSLCNSATMSNHNTSLSALMDLLASAIVAAPEADVVATFTGARARLWHNFSTVFDHLAVRQTLGRAVSVDVLKALQALSAIAPLKETVGDLMDSVAQILHDADGRYGGAAQRIVATCLINLVNGSKLNKDRVTPLLHHVANVIVTTDDFFLQLQCSEIIFRVVRLKPAILQHLTALPPLLRTGFASVPADPTMLDCINRLLEQFNRTQVPPKIITVEVASVGIVRGPKEEKRAPEPLCGATTAYFGRKAALVMLPGAVGEHIVFEYTSFVSFSINTQCQLTFRIRTPPPQLQSRMSNHETICLQLTAGVVQQVKLSPLHDWIAATRTQTTPQGGATPVALPTGKAATWQQASTDASPAHGVAAPPAVTTTVVGPAPSALSRSRGPAAASVNRAATSVAPQHQQPSATTSVARGHRPRDEINAAGAAEHDADSMRDAVADPYQRVAEHYAPPPLAPPPARRHMAERDSNGLPRAGGKGPSMPPPSAPIAPSKQQVDVSLRYTASLPQLGADLGSAFGADDDDVAFAPPLLRSTTASSSSVPTYGGMDSFNAPQRLTVDNVDVMLEQVKRNVSDRVDAAQTEAKTLLATAKGMVRAQVQNVVEANRKDRDAFDVFLSQTLRELRGEEAETRAFVTETCGGISTDLENLRGVADVVEQRIAALSSMIDDVVQQSCATEIELLRNFKASVDADIATLEETLMRAASAVNTQELMHQLMQRQAAAFARA